MRKAALLFLLAVLLLVCGAASPETPLAEPKACADCLVLSPADVEKMKADFMDLARQAYRAGQADVRQRCASLI